jgi:hypothetical protein
MHAAASVGRLWCLGEGEADVVGYRPSAGDAALTCRMPLGRSAHVVSESVWQPCFQDRMPDSGIIRRFPKVGKCLGAPSKATAKQGESVLYNRIAWPLAQRMGISIVYHYTIVPLPIRASQLSFIFC